MQGKPCWTNSKSLVSRVEDCDAPVPNAATREAATTRSRWRRRPTATSSPSCFSHWSPRVVVSNLPQDPRRMHLVRQRTRVKSQVHAILARDLVPTCPHSDLSGGVGSRWLAKQQVSADEERSIDALPHQLDFHGDELAEVDHDLAVEAIDDSVVARLIPADHPIRRIRAVVDEVLAGLDDRFDAMYAESGRRSVPPETLLKATVLMAMYSIRSERAFCERLNYDMLFKWFLDLAIDARAFDPTTFTKNRQRLLDHQIADEFFAAVVVQAKLRRYTSSEHFSVDGTLLQAWASNKSFKPNNRPDDSGDGGDGNGFKGRNPEVDFKGQKRSNKTHTSTTDPEAKLFRKSSNAAAELSYMGHLLIENRSGLIIDAELTQATGYAERDCATEMLARLPATRRRRTVAADKSYDTRDFVAGVRDSSPTSNNTIRASTAPHNPPVPIMDLTPLNEREVTEHGPHTGGESLSSVDDDEQPGAVVDASLDDVSQQRGDDGLVLGVPEPQPDRDLGAIGGHNQGDHAHLPREVDAVDHQHRRVQARQVTAQQLVEGLAGAGHEPSRHRRLRRRRRCLAGLCADRIGGPFERAGGDPGQHALDGDPVQQVALGEDAIRRQPDLTSALAVAVEGVHAGPADRQPLAAHHDRRWCRSAPDMITIGIACVPRSTERISLFVHDRQRRRQPGLDRHSNQALTARLRNPAQRHREAVGHATRECLIGRIDQPHGRSVYLLHQVVPFLQVVVEDLLTMPHRHRPEGDHHPSTSTAPGTTSVRLLPHG